MQDYGTDCRWGWRQLSASWLRFLQVVAAKQEERPRVMLKLVQFLQHSGVLGEARESRSASLYLKCVLVVVVVVIKVLAGREIRVVISFPTIFPRLNPAKRALDPTDCQLPKLVLKCMYCIHCQTHCQVPKLFLALIMVFADHNKDFGVGYKGYWKYK